MRAEPRRAEPTRAKPRRTEPARSASAPSQTVSSITESTEPTDSETTQRLNDSPATQAAQAAQAAQVQVPETLEQVDKVVRPPAGSKVRPLKRAAPVAVKKPKRPLASPKADTPAVDAQFENNLAKQPPRALKSPIRIFQIYFEAWQRELLDPAFYPLDNSRGSSELMEFSVFEQLQKNPATEGATLWGALSWRFGEKTGMLGNDWVKQIVDHPGYDVYFCNPHTHNEAIFHNMWLQGETSHPNFVEISKAFFQAAGLDDKEITSIHPSSIYSAANYFVATPQFWALFIPYVRKVLVAADRKLPPRVRDVLHSKVADDKGLHGGATYIPFIVERLFGLFMRTEGKNLKGYKIALPERERELNVHLKLLREMKDVSHRTQSAWLAACWVNYRNLYLSQTNTKAWCDQYLRAITPTEVRFV